jgi:hypothetical protein
VSVVFEIGGVIALVAIGLWLWALLECIVTEGRRCRNLPKLVWLLLIVFLPLIGTVGWFAFGRPRRDDSGARPRAARAAHRPPVSEAAPRVADSGAMSDRRSAELDRQLEAWEAEQARGPTEPDDH